MFCMQQDSPTGCSDCVTVPKPWFIHTFLIIGIYTYQLILDLVLKVSLYD